MNETAPSNSFPGMSPGTPLPENRVPDAGKWTDIEHLPQWDEEFYHVYTAKKHGKWVMLKTLRPEMKAVPDCAIMIEKEFEVRYNLAHPNIIMINDFEEVPGLGKCIITDDVYGDSLAKIIAEGRATELHLEKICHQLLDALDYIQTNHLVHKPLSASRIIFTENINNLKLIDVGFDQKTHISQQDNEDDIYNFGLILQQTLDALPTHHSHLQKVAEKCLRPDPRKRYRDVNEIRMAVADRKTSNFYIAIISFLVVMILLLLWLVSPYHPDTMDEKIENAEIPVETMELPQD